MNPQARYPQETLEPGESGLLLARSRSGPLTQRI